MDIRYLNDEPGVVSTLAEWIYDEWGKNIAHRTLETAHEKVRQTVGREDIPLTLVCFVDGEPAGTASIDTADMSTHPDFSPWMASVYVAPSMRRQGIGTELCKRIKQELKRLEVRKAYLYTPDQEKLYQRLGWQTILRESYHDQPVVIMQLELE